MIRPRRRQRETLRGWWRVVPFVLMLGATLMVFTWLHTQRLKNEYRANELAREIRRVNDRIADLRGERYHLGRLSRMDAAAPEHALVEPRPGQIRMLKITAEELAALDTHRIEVPQRARVTRSVVVRVDGMVPAGRAPVSDSAVAQHADDGAEATESHL